MGAEKSRRRKPLSADNERFLFMMLTERSVGRFRGEWLGQVFYHIGGIAGLPYLSLRRGMCLIPAFRSTVFGKVRCVEMGGIAPALETDHPSLRRNLVSTIPFTVPEKPPIRSTGDLSHIKIPFSNPAAARP